MTAALMLACALLAAPSPHLQEGIRLYRAQNYSEALEALTRAIDETNSARDKARIHVYIGLIQFRFTMTNDASASFQRALDYDSKLELPKKHSQPAAKKLFAKIKRERFGDDPPKRKKKRSKEEPKDEPPGEAKLEPPPPQPIEEPPPPPPPPEVAVVPPPPPPEIEPPPPPPPAIAPPVVTTEDSGPNLPAWISIGAGAAAAVTAIVLGGVSLYNFETDDNQPFADDAKARYDAAVKQRTGAIIAGSVGVVGLSVGTTLFLVE